MATDADFINFISDQIQNAGLISYRKMFGEYTLYCDGKVVALVCDNKLYIKPTTAGSKFIDQITEAPPYPGAKMYYLIEDKIEDSEWLTELVRLTADELPKPKPKKHKK